MANFEMTPEMVKAFSDESDPMHDYMLAMLEDEKFAGADFSKMKAPNMPWNADMIKSVGGTVEDTGITGLAAKTAGVMPSSGSMFKAPSSLSAIGKAPVQDFNAGFSPTTSGAGPSVQMPSLLNSPKAQASIANATAGANTTGTVAAGAQAPAAGGGMSAGQIGAISAGANFIVDQVGQVAQAKKNLKTDEYLMDVNYWKQQGKEWFDPNANTFPSFDEYSKSMPSATEAMKEGSLTGHPIIEGTAGGALKGAATGASIGATIGLFGGPVTVGAGALIGAGVGFFVGGVTGLVSSIMGWDSAKEQDKKEKERAYAEYRRNLQEWTYRKNEQYLAGKRQAQAEYSAKSMAIAAATRQGKQQDIIDAREKVTTNRNQMMSVLANVGTAAKDEKQARLSRWG